MKQLEVFNYRGYGDYGCSKCKSPLVGRFTSICNISIKGSNMLPLFYV